MPFYLITWSESVVIEAPNEEAARERWMDADHDEGDVELVSIDELPLEA